MTVFEQGYADRLAGKELEDNPYEKEKNPFSFKRWREGWIKCHNSRKS